METPVEDSCLSEVDNQRHSNSWYAYAGGIIWEGIIFLILSLKKEILKTG